MKVLNYNIKHFTIDPTSFTPIYPGMTGSKLVLSRGRDNDGFLVRTDENDVTTQLEIAIGHSHEIITNPGTFYAAFSPERVACFVQAANFVGTLIVETIP